MKTYFRNDPMEIGEARRLTVMGEGPFKIRAYAIVRGMGSKPKSVWEMEGIAPGRAVIVKADSSVWQERSGTLVIDISDGKGDQSEVSVVVRPPDPISCVRMLVCA